MAIKEKLPGRKGKGGPNTAAGKARSSRNSTKHGVKAKNTLILWDETTEDFDETQHGWQEEYEPEGYAEERLVKQLILNDWFLQRATRRLQEAEAAVMDGKVDPLRWSEKKRGHLQLMQRYKTTAERAFYRSLTAVQGLRKDRMFMDRELKKAQEHGKRISQLEDGMEKIEKFLQPPVNAGPLGDITKKNPFGNGPAAAEAKTAAQMLFQGQLHPKKQRKIAVLDQWIEVTVEDGKTVTTLHPPNDELIRAGQRMLPPPEMVYRRFNFVGPVPPEYRWSTKDPIMLANGGMGIQRMYVDTWLEVIEKEKALGTGHLGPTGVGNMPRPMERGGCDCEVCAGNRAILEARGAA